MVWLLGQPASQGCFFPVEVLISWSYQCLMQFLFGQDIKQANGSSCSSNAIEGGTCSFQRTSGCLTVKNFGVFCFLVGLGGFWYVFFLCTFSFFISACKLLFPVLQRILGSSVEYVNKLFVASHIPAFFWRYFIGP